MKIQSERQQTDKQKIKSKHITENKKEMKKSDPTKHQG
jgi:hypothetical protein